MLLFFMLAAVAAVGGRAVMDQVGTVVVAMPRLGMVTLGPRTRAVVAGQAVQKVDLVVRV